MLKQQLALDSLDCTRPQRRGQAETRCPALLVSAGSCICALPLPDVVETMRPQATEPLAGLPSFVRGVSVIRGAPIPVVDLALLLGSVNGNGETGRFVTLRMGDRRVALAVEAVLGLRELDASMLQETPPLLGDAGGNLVEAIGTLDEELLLVLRTARVLPEELREALAAPEAGPAGTEAP